MTNVITNSFEAQTVKMVSIQKQSAGSNNCGLFAIAVCMALLLKKIQHSWCLMKLRCDLIFMNALQKASLPTFLPLCRDIYYAVYLWWSIKYELYSRVTKRPRNTIVWIFSFMFALTNEINYITIILCVICDQISENHYNRALVHLWFQCSKNTLNY